MQIDKIEEDYNDMQGVKRRFFAFRNGVMGDMLRRAGDKHRIIFGLNLPQLKEIAAVYGHNILLAGELWGDCHVRESRLLAPMLVDERNFSDNDVREWLEHTPYTTEEADILCHFLLRKLSFADKLIEEYKDDANSWLRYVALRLCFSIVSQNPEYVMPIAEKEIGRNDAVTSSVARQLLDEALFVAGS